MPSYSYVHLVIVEYVYAANDAKFCLLNFSSPQLVNAIIINYV